MISRLSISRRKDKSTQRQKLLEPTPIINFNTANEKASYIPDPNNIRRDTNKFSSKMGTDTRINKTFILEKITSNKYNNNQINSQDSISNITIDDLDKDINLEKSSCNRIYNWKKSQEVPTDTFQTFQFRLRLPILVDLRKTFSHVYDQGILGSCTANSVCSAYKYNVNRQKGPSFEPSRLFVYYNTRLIENSIDEDAGATLRESMNSINKYGACEEALHPYIIDKFKEKPSEAAYKDGLDHQTLVFRRVPHNLTDMKRCIAEGFPFVFGFLVFSSFESARTTRTGIMTMPRRGEQIYGGHAVIACGYDDRRQVFIIRNSWGTKWGDKGDFYMPYSFISNRSYCGDFWTIRSVE
jgi:C1A family cysteine protease